MKKFLLSLIMVCSVHAAALELEYSNRLDANRHELSLLVPVNRTFSLVGKSSLFNYPETPVSVFGGFGSYTRLNIFTLANTYSIGVVGEERIFTHLIDNSVGIRIIDRRITLGMFGGVETFIIENDSVAIGHILYGRFAIGWRL